jgi:hypothetical protein
MRAAVLKPVLARVERRRKKNKREKAHRRRTRTMSLYTEQNERTFMRNLVLLIYL